MDAPVSRAAGGDFERYAALRDPAGRAARGRRIVAMLRALHRADLAGCRVLDVGCSAGLVVREVAGAVRFAVGVDVDAGAVAHASRECARPGRLAFARASGAALPFPPASFDVALCNHVYEHVADPHALLAEIARVLVPGGACWFAAGHTWQWIEPHYRLPLLALLPRGLASAWVRASGRGERYDVAYAAPWRVRELFAPFAEARLVSVEMLRDPVRYESAAGLLRSRAVRALVRPLARPLAWLAPTQLWILRKG